MIEFKNPVLLNELSIVGLRGIEIDADFALLHCNILEKTNVKDIFNDTKLTIRFNDINICYLSIDNNHIDYPSIYVCLFADTHQQYDSIVDKFGSQKKFIKNFFVFIHSDLFDLVLEFNQVMTNIVINDSRLAGNASM